MKFGICIAVLLVCLAILLGGRLWPFSRDAVVQDLRDASDSQITLRSFDRTYFPYPGCVIEDLVFRHGSPQNPPLIVIKKLTVRGSYLGMLRHEVSTITADGMTITVPALGRHEPFHTTPSTIVVNTFIANGAVLEFASRIPEKPRLRFDIHEATLRNVGPTGPMQYRLKVHNPEPPGEVSVSGDFGHWKIGDAGETPLSGKYTFEHADLGTFGGIAGILSSKGNFSGVLKHIDISGSTDVPDFMVKSSGHRVELITDFDAYVDATRGDTFLKRVDAHFGRTRVIAQGSIAGSPGHKGKIALIDLRSDQGRIEDILGLFSRERRAPMAGEIALVAKAEIPGGKEPFLDRVILKGEFGIDQGKFSKPDTQTNVNKLSAGARGENKDDPDNVLSNLKGRVVLEHGVANFSDLSFGIPGALARMQGTYGVIDHRVNLHGTMQVDTQISKTTTGMKAFVLKVIDPIFKKKKKGEIVPVHVGGTYEKPDFGLDVGKQENQPATRAGKSQR